MKRPRFALRQLFAVVFSIAVGLCMWRFGARLHGEAAFTAYYFGGATMLVAVLSLFWKDDEQAS